MTDCLNGRYFLPGSARFVPARARLAEDRVLRIEDETGAKLDQAPLSSTQVSARLGRIARRFDLPGGGHFEADDNDAVDALLARDGRRASRLHRWESSWRWALGSVAIAGAAVYAFIVYGIPASALWLAQVTPPAVNGIIERQALQVMDRTLLSPTTLSTFDQEKAKADFARVAATGARGAEGYHLLFRNSKTIGPNAFALPDGSIVMTDELWKLAEQDEEIEGVFAHEIAHVDRSHSLQQLYQAAIVPAAIAVVTGDLSQVTQLATLLPGILVQAAYSRTLEQQADDDAAVTLKKLGADPGHLADLLERLEKKVCKEKLCGAGWLGDHPETDERVMRLRRAGSGSSTPEKKDSI